MTEDVAAEAAIEAAAEVETQPTAVQEAPAAEAPTGAVIVEQDSPALSLASQVEALLYASGEPASLAALAGALDATNGEIEAALEELTSLYAVRGIRLQRSGNKVQLVTAPEIAPKVQKFLGLEEVNRLSSAALETLAIIAYNQPITRPQMEMIRGVNCDGVITTLLARNLIQELGRADTVGHPMRYGVSFEFLQYFGLRNVHELPPVEKLDTLPVEKGEPVVDAPADTDGVADALPPEALAEGEAPATVQNDAGETPANVVEASTSVSDEQPVATAVAESIEAEADASEHHPAERDGSQ
jgi:segregation and condensation protein B